MVQRTITIEKKSRDVPEAAEAVRRALAGRPRKAVTAGDAAALTGLPIDACEKGLVFLGARHPCRVQVTDQGVLTWDFERLDLPEAARGPSLAVRMARRLRDWMFLWGIHFLGPWLVLIAAGDVLQSYVMTTQIGTGVAWSLLGVPLALAAVAMALVGAFWLVFVQGVAFLGLAAIAFGVLTLLQNAGVLAFREPATSPAWQAAVFIGFGGLVTALGVLLARVMSGGRRAPRLRKGLDVLSGLLLGPRPAVADPLADERRLVDAIRAAKGILTAADLVRLFGWDLARARAETTRILVDYGGDVIVTDDGVLVFRFDDLFESEAAGRARDVRPFWELPDPPERFLGCPPKVGWIGLVVAVAALVGAASGGALADLGGGAIPYLRKIGIGLYALTVAALVVRVPFWRRRVRLREARVRFTELARIACTTPAGAPSPAGGIDSRLLVSLDGTVDVDPDSAAIVVRFPGFQQMIEAAEALRRGQTRKGRGSVVYDTGTDVM